MLVSSGPTFFVKTVLFAPTLCSYDYLASTPNSEPSELNVLKRKDFFTGRTTDERGTLRMFRLQRKAKFVILPYKTIEWKTEVPSARMAP